MLAASTSFARAVGPAGWRARRRPSPISKRGKSTKMDIPEPFSHCYARTLRIVTTADGTSSSFVMDYKGQQWLVTGIHCVEEQSGKKKPFGVLDQNGVDHSGLCERVPRISVADIAVFRLRAEGLDFGSPLEPYDSDDISAMQELRFLGFPKLNESYKLNYASPTIPIIKQALLSGETDYPGESDPYSVKAWLLDGMSSGGFSGGPVIIQEPEGYRVFGVVSSYVPANAPVSVGPPPPPPNGPVAQTNMGLMIVFDISYAIEAIDAWLDSQPPK
jgi:hypothetical protein